MTIEPEEGLIAFGNVLVNDTVEKAFKIKNVSSFPAKFNLQSQVQGCINNKKVVPFVLIPATATIPAKTTYEVKILFQPDHVDNHYFDVLLIDIPNQIKAKKVYLRRQA